MFQPDRKQQLIILILAAVILFGGGYKYAQWQGKKALALEESTPALEPFNPGGSAAEAPEIVVHVDGAVEKPGVYRLAAGSRVADALEKAVVRTDADPGALNLASVLKDGQKVPVPFKQTPGSGDGMAGGGGVTGMSPGATKTVSDASTGLVNINTAGPEELEKLPGIGPSLAQRIIRYRETNGPFAAPEDIKNVSGIGEKKYEQLKDFISN